MTSNKRQWAREDVTVPCQIGYIEDNRHPSRACVLNLSQGGIMLSTEEGFVPNQRVAITLDQDYDSLLFDFADILTGVVRWSQVIPDNARFPYQVGVSFDQELPHRLHLTEH